MTRHRRAKIPVKGYPCPNCGQGSMILETRPHGMGVKRQRKCEQGHRFTTVETVLEAVSYTQDGFTRSTPP